METDRQWALEGLITGLERLHTVLGADVLPVVEKARAALLRALAARDKGDLDEVKLHIGSAMAELAALGGRLDAAEGLAMRSLSAEFVAGMSRGDREAMERNLDRIQQRAGKPKERKEM